MKPTLKEIKDGCANELWCSLCRKLMGWSGYSYNEELMLFICDDCKKYEPNRKTKVKAAKLR